jgi:polar amino acid transport system substrate-binding protein
MLKAGKAATDYESALNESSVSAVLISTRHNLHAAQTIAAAKAGKHIFVEKPLGLTVEECEQVIAEVEKANVLCTVGFNRRFSPYALEAKKVLESLAGAKQIVCRVNAGALPKNHWLLDPSEGGGRIIGEGCHFFDLMTWLAGSTPVSVSAQKIGEDENEVSAAVKFSDGSLGTLIYTGLGDSRYSKERVEIFAGGGVIVIDDFRSVEFSGARGKNMKGAQDKGHRALLKNFIEAMQGKSQLMITAQDGLRATACGEATLNAIGSGQVQKI